MSPPNFCPGLANSGRACGAPGLLIWVESPNLLSCCRSQGEAIGVIADCVATPDGRFCIHELRRRPRWTTRHPASNRKQADCRPLLQQSPPNRGGPSGVTRGSSSLSSLPSSSTWASRRSALHSHRFRCPKEAKLPHPGSLGPRRQGQQLHSSKKTGNFYAKQRDGFLSPRVAPPGAF